MPDHDPDVAAVLAEGIYADTWTEPDPNNPPEWHHRFAWWQAVAATRLALAALTAAGYAVVSLSEPAGWAANAATRQTELDEYGYFSANGEPDRDHPVPLYAIEAPSEAP